MSVKPDLKNVVEGWLSQYIRVTSEDQLNYFLANICLLQNRNQWYYKVRYTALTENLLPANGLDFNVGHLGLPVDALQDARHDLSRSALVPVLEALPHDVSKALLELHRIRHLGGGRKNGKYFIVYHDSELRKSAV